ncbi:thiamine phosphate synthase [Halovenus sp. WSH3]|uniref:Thiamine-phosphate synthase n=1 Tax=Halovenus carboxidivorans TaxID=2692199 RepID=A0A6B0T5Q6_9EURY|nr:thiamine phosphate synthase [Halovenus carboxidivorans]MXR50893.1 thiamine phosphate synthase [Halovenus carboxidivorans]
MTLTLDTYLVTQQDLSAGRSTESIVADAIAGGVDVVQVREKDRTARTQLETAEALREPTAEAGVPLIINDRVDIALAADADGVHLGDDDLPISVAREQLGEDAIIGRSVSTVEAAREAEEAGADYLGVGAVYTTASKDVDDEENGIGLDVVGEIANAVDIPFVGIGGVTPERAPDVVEAGADGVAVITAITQADDPERATRELGEAVEQGKRRRDELEGEA